MFNRYWRSYPWWMQLLQFVLMIFIFLGLALALTTVLVPLLTGHKTTDILQLTENSRQSLVNAALLQQTVFALCTFLLPPLLFAYATHPQPKQYLGLRAPGKASHWLLVPVVIVSATVILIGISSLLQQIDLGTDAKTAQDTIERTTRAFLKMPNFSDFLITFFVMVMLPGIGEELMFRGVVMRFAAKRRNIAYALFMSALLFALMHGTYYNFVPIFLAGVLLGGIYYLTGSIWCSMLAHIINNGLQVLLIFIFRNDEAVKKMLENDTLPWYWVAIAVVVFAVSFFALWKNRTPLSKNWAEDYSKEELIAGEE